MLVEISVLWPYKRKTGFAKCMSVYLYAGVEKTKLD